MWERESECGREGVGEGVGDSERVGVGDRERVGVGDRERVGEGDRESWRVRREEGGRQEGK